MSSLKFEVFDTLGVGGWAGGLEVRTLSNIDNTQGRTRAEGRLVLFHRIEMRSRQRHVRMRLRARHGRTWAHTLRRETQPVRLCNVHTERTVRNVRMRGRGTLVERARHATLLSSQLSLGFLSAFDD